MSPGVSACSALPTGRFAEAAALGTDALVLLRQHAGPKHPSTLQCLNNLAVALSKLGATALLRMGGRAALRLIGPPSGDNTSYLRSRSHSSGLSYSLYRSHHTGEPEREELVRRELLAAKREALGSAHADTLAAGSALAVFLAKSGRGAIDGGVYFSAACRVEWQPCDAHY